MGLSGIIATRRGKVGIQNIGKVIESWGGGTRVR